MYGLTKAGCRKRIPYEYDPGWENEESPPMSSGDTGHSMVAGLDCFPSVPMNRPSPIVVQAITDKQK